MKMDNIDTTFIPNLPKGPLDTYRDRATFNWKKLKINLTDADMLRIKYKVWRLLEADPLFAKPKGTLTADEQKHRAAKQMLRVGNSEFIPEAIHSAPYKNRTRYYMTVNEAMHSVCPSFSIKIALGVGLFNNALIAMGTQKHLKYCTAAWKREIITCMAITEVSHGSNTKRTRTMARYDPKTEEFIIHTPDFEAAKCWVGNLGKTSTIALVFAILYTPDNVSHGLHGFLVPIRDPNTLQTYPGVIVGDIGEKVGLNGIDNGFLVFSNYRVPRENLLNRTGDVTPDGTYESVFTEPTKVLGAALESFSAGRVGIMQESSNTLAHAAVIAIRYSALRKQFGPEINGPEVPIIEYQLHQWRIFPYLAAACVLKTFVYVLTDKYLHIIEKSQADSNGFEALSQLVSEVHAIISSSKPLITWTARDAIQEAREACGGHGYLKASNLGELRNNHDASCTYEGDNNVLGQQASNWLLRQWNGPVESPVGSATFLNRKTEILTKKFKNIDFARKMDGIKFVTECYEWLICWLLHSTASTIEESIQNGTDKFQARNDTQVYKARDVTKAYAEYTAFGSYKIKCLKSDPDPELKPILKTIFMIYGLWCLDKHMTTFYLGGFAIGTEFANFVRSELLRHCAELKDNAVTVADSLAPPDFVLNSVIGQSDGRLYENIQHEFMTNPGAMERASWWQDVLPIKAKL